jgi:Zn-finger nucleic acid-binding protein
MSVTSFTCPVDGAVLVPIERQGIEIDHCPQCRGVWLDRGELDKLIERSTAAAPPPREPSREPYREQRAQYDEHRGHGHPPKRRKSFLEELFD